MDQKSSNGVQYQCTLKEKLETLFLLNTFTAWLVYFAIIGSSSILEDWKTLRTVNVDFGFHAVRLSTSWNVIEGENGCVMDDA